MRALEILMLVIHVIWIIQLMFKKHGKQTLWLCGASAAVMLSQLYVEGYRFHGLPLYLQFVILAIITFKPSKRETSKMKKQVMSKLIISVTWCVYVTLAILLPSVFPVFTYSKPSGAFPIGTIVYDWADSTRDESLSPDQHDNRKLAVQVWYPAEPGQGTKKSRLVTNPQAVAQGLESLTNMPSYFFDHLKYIQTNAVEDAPVSLKQTNYPVILFSHGFGSGYRSQSVYQVQELASQGYIVVTIDHTYFSLSTIYSDGHAVPFDTALSWPTLINDKSRGYVDIWAQDAIFVINQLEQINQSNPQSKLYNKMDLSKIGYLGASFGGPAAARAMQLDERITAGVNQDGKPFYHEELVQNGLKQPFMYMQSSQSISDIGDAQLQEYGVTREEWNKLPVEIETDIGRFFNSLKGSGYIVKIAGTEHLTFSDMYLLIRLPNSKNKAVRDAHQIINDYTLSFFNKHLGVNEEKGASLLDVSKANPGEIEIRTK